MKKCSDCHQIKSFDQFVAKASCRDGYEPRCRVCRSIKYNKSTPDLFFKKIYHSQKIAALGRGHPPPSYSLEDLKIWADKQPNLFQLWNDYVNSAYNKNLAPSIDRIDDSKGYDLNNIQLMTWNQNRAKGAKSKMAGTVNARQRPVAAYHLDGSLHKKYISIMDAVRDINGRMWGIVSVANDSLIKDGKGYFYKPHSYKGFVWKWL